MSRRASEAPRVKKKHGTVFRIQFELVANDSDLEAQRS
jgi:hypothetical protein